MPTSKISLSDDAWSDLGSGPMHVYAPQFQNVRLHFGTDAPAVDTGAYVPLGGPSGRDYQGSEKVFARADHGAAHVILVAGGA